MSLKKLAILLGMVLMLAVVVTACANPTPAPTEPPTSEPTEVPPPTAVPPTPTPDPAAIAAEEFAGAGHADGTGEAFIHWDAANPAEIPTSCAKCHSSAGFQDFLADGKVDTAVAAPGAPFTCETCHNDAAAAQTEVVFPSGTVISAEMAGPSAVCMNCHQGRESKVSLDKKLAGFGENLDPDAAPTPYKNDQGNDVTLSFSNIHYYAAAATLYGSEVSGGYQYDGKKYDVKNSHVDMANSCVGCHNQHSLELQLDKCQICHGEEAATTEGLKNIREPSSAMDYDGDGDNTEGVAYEIEGLQAILYSSIQAYAKEVAGAEIKYDAITYPYFMGMDGKAYPNWTPRLLKAAYNYQTSIKDPGAFAHGGKYIIELLYDSIEDLNASEKLTTKFDVSALTRNDAGHFDGSAEAWRHWDLDDDGNPVFIVEAACAKCHSASGLPILLAGETVPEEGVPAGNGLMCSTCHDEANWPNRYAVNDVTFPSGKVVTFGEGDGSNLCLNCHQGRASKGTVDQAIADFNVGDKLDDVVAPVEKDGKKLTFGFKNIHYFPAGVTVFGTDVQGAYEYDGQTYVGLTSHPINKCADCHNVHALEPKLDACANCHGAVTDPKAIRMPATVDYDGDGDVTEGVSGEIATLQEALYAQMQKYAADKGNPIEYKSFAYPYFFGADGKGYAVWTPRLLKAAYNYQYSVKDPGDYVHNPKYVVQILVDSIADLGGDVSKYTRP